MTENHYCFWGFSVGVGTFVIGLSQISSFFLLSCRNNEPYYTEDLQVYYIYLKDAWCTQSTSGIFIKTLRFSSYSVRRLLLHKIVLYSLLTDTIVSIDGLQQNQPYAGL